MCVGNVTLRLDRHILCLCINLIKFLHGVILYVFFSYTVYTVYNISTLLLYDTSTAELGLSVTSVPSCIIPSSIVRESNLIAQSQLIISQIVGSTVQIQIADFGISGN